MNNNDSKQKPIELKDVYEILTDIHDTIKESTKWTKFAGIKEVKPILETQLPNDSKKLIYHLSDGTKGTQEIAKTVGGVSHQSVSNYWKTWEKVGLGEYISAPGGTRFRRSFDLADLGITIPEIQKQVEQHELVTPAEKTEVEENVNE